jgi:hypothetical protein
MIILYLFDYDFVQKQKSLIMIIMFGHIFNFSKRSSNISRVILCIVYLYQLTRYMKIKMNYLIDQITDYIHILVYYIGFNSNNLLNYYIYLFYFYLSID